MFSVVFPGQGSQSVGMGSEIHKNYGYIQDLFSNADDILGFNLSKLILEGPKENLDLTEFTAVEVYLQDTINWGELLLMVEPGNLRSAGKSLSRVQNLLLWHLALLLMTICSEYLCQHLFIIYTEMGWSSKTAWLL